jgi:hypothetical protein
VPSASANKRRHSNKPIDPPGIPRETSSRRSGQIGVSTVVSQNQLQRLHAAGVSIWLDTLSRQLLDSGDFATLIHDYALGERIEG